MSHNSESGEVAYGYSDGVCLRINDAALKLNPFPADLIPGSYNQFLLANPLRYLRLIIGYGQDCWWRKGGVIGSDIIDKSDKIAILGWCRWLFKLNNSYPCHWLTVFIQCFNTFIKRDTAFRICRRGDDSFGNYSLLVNLAFGIGNPGGWLFGNVLFIAAR